MHLGYAASKIIIMILVTNTCEVMGGDHIGISLDLLLHVKHGASCGHQECMYKNS